MNLDKLQLDYIRDCVELCVKMEIEFHKMGGVIADKKVTIGGHKIPCSICGRNGRRYVPNGKPICEKCWSHTIDEGINRLAVTYMLKGAVEALYDSIEDRKETVE